MEKIIKSLLAPPTKDIRFYFLVFFIMAPIGNMANMIPNDGVAVVLLLHIMPAAVFLAYLISEKSISVKCLKVLNFSIYYAFLITIFSIILPSWSTLFRLESILGLLLGIPRAILFYGIPVFLSAYVANSLSKIFYELYKILSSKTCK